jgi:hypothetical protein
LETDKRPNDRFWSRIKEDVKNNDRGIRHSEIGLKLIKNKVLRLKAWGANYLSIIAKLATFGFIEDDKENSFFELKVITFVYAYPSPKKVRIIFGVFYLTVILAVSLLQDIRCTIE